MGPWAHGAWSRSGGDHLGHVQFGSRTSDFYQENIELPFFRHFLKGEGELDLPEAYVFETGANRWRTFAAWPPENLRAQRLFVREGGGLSFTSPTDMSHGLDEFTSDPSRPVPYTEAVNKGMTREYMTDDQRFAARRPDVLVYQTDVLDENVTLAGPIVADLWVSTTGTDADWVVKVIDVFPPDAPDYDGIPKGVHMGNYHMMVRSEVIRSRFRNSYTHPEPFVPDQPTNVRFELQDVLHTFQKGHRIQVQVQSTWFPLVDRNPQKYVPNIFEADDADFIVATHRVYRDAKHATSLIVGVLPAEPAAEQPPPVTGTGL